MTRRIAPVAIALTTLAAAAALAGCGSDSTSSSTTSAPSGSSSSAPAAAGDVAAQIQARGKPKVSAPAAPATALGIKDLVVGTGATVAAGATVTVQYVGVGQTTGKEFDSSWAAGQPATFPLTGVIKGWTDGIPGMKVGGRRQLVIPGDQAYGANPPPGSGIQPNETLVFVIDLVAVQS